MMKFDFDDILIEPAIQSSISTRSVIDVHYNNGFLPIFTAPMDTVVSVDNIHDFHDNKIGVVLPRTAKLYGSTNDRLFTSGGLDISDEYWDMNRSPFYFLIDIANGHMTKLYDKIKYLKDKHGNNIIIMAGNVAHPRTYVALSNAGADYVRVGIGNGGGCLTTQQTGIGYPMGSLIKECYDVSCELINPAKIVADGGFKKYADVIKALALGADYVMLGSIFNKSFESAGEMAIDYNGNIVSVDEYIKSYYSVYSYVPPPKSLVKDELLTMMDHGHLYKKFRGMSTKDAQRAMGNTTLKTSEGISKYQKVEYTLSGWVDNFEHYLRSAMSYADCYSLSDFIGKVKYNLITNNAYNRYNK